MGFSFHSHTPQTTEGIFRGYKVNPYITVKIGEHTVNIQGGAFWGSGGDQLELEDIPSIIWDHIEKMPLEARKSVGLEHIKRPGSVAAKKG
jgi:hypothetical protein